MWSEGRNAEYWQAAMLSLKLQPSRLNKYKLRRYFPDLYQNYLMRYDVLKRRASTRSIIKPIRNLLGKSSEKLVSLPGVAKIAMECDWEYSEEFQIKISLPRKIKTIDGSYINSFDDEDELSNGDLNTRVRYAALVEIIRMFLSRSDDFNEFHKSVFKRSTVSNQELGEAVERVIAKMAKDNNLKSIYGFAKEKNAKEIGEIDKISKNFFTSK